MLHTATGRPRISILSIAHLDEAEQMFFVSLLLSQIVAWMRTQSGTGSLRAILYMDEIHGFFPPVANPPSKAPMLTLLRQARAYGLGVLLTTQNPVDIDYKGLSNAGTWLIGRLQTKQDRSRVLAGMEGASRAQGVLFDRAGMERTLAGLGKRVFVMHHVHQEQPTIFESRWCMSYLRGPFTRTEMEKLQTMLSPSATLLTNETSEGPRILSTQATRQMEQDTWFATAPLETTATCARDLATSADGDYTAMASALPEAIQMLHLPLRGSAGGSFIYRPALLGVADIGFRENASSVQAARSVIAVAGLQHDVLPVDWNQAQVLDLAVSELTPIPQPGISYARLPHAATVLKNYTAWSREFSDWLYRTQTLTLYKSILLKTMSQPDESEGDFRARIRLQAREQRDAQLEALRKKYTVKANALAERMRKAQQAVEREKDMAKQQKVQTAISLGATLLSSFLGNNRVSATSVGKATTTMRGASQALKKSGDVARSRETVDALQRQQAELEATFQKEVTANAARWDPQQQQLQMVTVRPLKQNIRVRLLALAWLPFRLPDQRKEKPAWE